MTRSKALAVAVSAAAVAGLALAVLLFSAPTPAVSHASYTWKPGCHCRAPKTTTTKKATTTTVKKVTTTVKRTPTTLVATTTSTQTTTTTLAAMSLTLAIDQKYAYGSSNDPKTMDVARAIVAGLALSGDSQPPAGSGPTGGPSESGASADGTSTGDDDLAAATPAEDPAAAESAAGDAQMTPPQYVVSPVAILFLLVYATSFILYRTKSIHVATHRKIWNVLLLTTFLITGALGIILAIGISQDPPWMMPQSLLFWHVETGVVMSLISLFHVGWHLRYYLAVATGRAGARRKPAEERPRPAPQHSRYPGYSGE